MVLNLVKYFDIRQKTKMTEVPYPYNLPPWRRQFYLTAPNGQKSAIIYEAWELFMSGPTYGKLFVGKDFRIENCSPTFAWSADSRYIAIPQWQGFWRRKEKILVLDMLEKKIYESREKYKLLIVDGFVNEEFLITESPIRKKKKLKISLRNVIETYKVKTNLLQGSESLQPKDYE